MSYREPGNGFFQIQFFSSGKQVRSHLFYGFAVSPVLVKVSSCKSDRRTMICYLPTDLHRSLVIQDAFQDFKAKKSPPPAFFYCSRSTSEPARSDPEKILASLARQLSNLQPEQKLLQPAVTVYKRKEAEGFASGPLQVKESRDLIVQLVELHTLSVIVIDALDECDPEKRSDLLNAFELILEESTHLVRIFISSRDDQDIVFHLGKYPNLQISSERNNEDIANFVRITSKELIRKGKLLRHSQSRTDMEDLIVRKVTEGAAEM